ncbi:MAG: hypothetical protein KDG50_15040 [Chromatiales bacterium]|nr:hypothetical protein [Chromatiales bacterium]
MVSTARSHLLIGLGLPAILAAICMASFQSFTVDDAYISFRYARNLADGHGLVYNTGEYVEGYTNLLWTLLLALAIKIGIDVELFSKLLGAAFAFVALYFTYQLAVRIKPLERAPVVATWIVAGSLVFTGYAVQGIESAMFAGLILAGTHRFFEEQEQELSVVGSALIFAAAGLTRPEAPMFLGLLMLGMTGKGVLGGARMAVLSKPDLRLKVLTIALCLIAGLVPWTLHLGETSSAGALLPGVVLVGLCVITAVLLPAAMFGRRNLLRGGVFLVPLLAQAIWRSNYYGEWLPNTLHAKTGDITQQFNAGLDYVSNFFVHEGLLALSALFGLVVAFTENNRRLLALALLTVYPCAYFVLVGGDWMPLFRFFVPVLPLLALLSDAALRGLLDSRVPALLYGAVSFVLVVALQMIGQYQSDAAVFRTAEAEWDLHAQRTAKWFEAQENAFGRDRVEGTIALGDIGEVGYRTNYPVLDLLGLVTRDIAELPGGYTRKIGAGYANYFFSKKPRYVIIISNRNSCSSPSVPGSAVLYHDARFLAQYTESGRVWAGGDYFWCIYQDREKVIDVADKSFTDAKLQELDSRFQTYNNVDLPGGDIDVLSFRDVWQIQARCRQACLDNAGCRAYTHTKPHASLGQGNGLCWLKGSVGRRIGHANLVSGERLAEP